MGKPPYGYRFDPAERNHWIIGEDADPVVKRIFDLSIARKRSSQIARILEAYKVLTARALCAQRKGVLLPERPYHWMEKSIVGILERMECTSYIYNFKTYSKSYKLKNHIPNASEDMLILPDTQEATAPKEQWDRIQELRQHKRRPIREKRQGMFAGLVVCADCGNKLRLLQEL